ncbi:TlyA family RNA methyltransferase [Roseibacillus persicicus]|uniref:TlyA family rRNA (Cytidine-2'-O)-methyltransferase n=1 Tax=Roseibacillus persicicus TaxID=454148 RepID=A0A918TY96_9BACT|nr:TlyA family RNA methyltransferase [Roseibacillus persicicus]MDQ8188823.1 TlyA family RNA methyltransferase [Roseibacillus persicicus]GHC66408.1 TlyA family rRNA (cytidine-2'-O)-methyltransferase [Roseibacillus persicicus]
MKERVDSLLVSRGLCESREVAKRLVMAGEVFLGTERVSKASSKVAPDADLSIREKPKFVGRGGLKLEGALEHFGIDVTDFVCLDTGSSTGGFTDCLLQRGASRVHAVDVGTNQLVYKLRTDPRVVVKEKFNSRYLTESDLGERVDIAVLDLSFISMTKVLPAVFSVLKEGGQVVALIKPQFELSRDEVSKGGIVREESLRQKAVDKIRNFVVEESGREWRGVMESPIQGTDGNVEFLGWF